MRLISDWIDEQQDQQKNPKPILVVIEKLHQKYQTIFFIFMGQIWWDFLRVKTPFKWQEGFASKNGYQVWSLLLSLDIQFQIYSTQYLYLFTKTRKFMSDLSNEKFKCITQKAPR